MMNKFLACLVVLLGISGSAFARDSSHLVCTGFVGEDGDKYGIAILFDDTRASDGESRNETLSTVWAGELYQGVRVNSDDLGRKGPITMTHKERSEQVFFSGEYELIQTRSGAYRLGINGEINLSPTTETSSSIPVATTLKCTDIST